MHSSLIFGPAGQVGRGFYLPLCHSSQKLSHNEVSTLCFWCLFNQRLNFTELSGYCCCVFSAFRRAFSIFKTQVNDEIRQESSLVFTGGDRQSTHMKYFYTNNKSHDRSNVLPMFILQYVYTAICIYCNQFSDTNLNARFSPKL